MLSASWQSPISTVVDFFLRRIGSVDPLPACLHLAVGFVANPLWFTVISRWHADTVVLRFDFGHVDFCPARIHCTSSRKVLSR
ncbi:hypothetical protein CH306_19245 [Rhodococcus sp. 15-725-2-2b]|nr:hypothetical protein CH277_19150 [Rhodococcus sp. 06-469-3-2]OZD43597.1 hypothetical protein CH264_18235 [Rhodococcus sp. 06-1477-1A]OZE13559.1 hypothetical protein CH250_06665 [Rhodococcus sp. 05-2255-3C]OZE15824.1 hypothetical protein CH249_00695 [Rhodococcus sp. 05-2255-3B1]OZE18864.1 hypothetical protein CH255_12720 [Rhodococcus sp. 05-2255-2A2]OZE71263.1 hypothetical protein CH306_19245 [Rhodococcus sp. 15-725-2-2b]